MKKLLLPTAKTGNRKPCKSKRQQSAESYLRKKTAIMAMTMTT